MFVKAYGADSKFGFRGDSLILTRSEGTRTRKYKSFKTEVETAFGIAFQTSHVDYAPTGGASVREVTHSILRGSHFEVLCVGLGCNDLLNPKTETVLPIYPTTLDAHLRELVAAVKLKSNNHLFLLAGHSSIWSYPAVWDDHIEHLHATLEDAGAVIVPQDEGTAVMSQMPLNSDGMHFLHDDEGRQVFAEAWVEWLVKFAGVGSDAAKAPRAKASETTVNGSTHSAETNGKVKGIPLAKPQIGIPLAKPQTLPKILQIQQNGKSEARDRSRSPPPLH